MTTNETTQSQAPTIPPVFSNCYECNHQVTPETGKIYPDRFGNRRLLCQSCMAGVKEEVGRNRFVRLMNLRSDGLEVPADLLDIKSDPEIETKNPEAYAAARSWDGQSSLFIHGPVGVGKTHIALCLLKKEFIHGYNVGIVSARRFCKTTDRFDEGGGILKKWNKTSLLLVDDLDKAVWTPERLGALWELFDIRRQEGLITIVTSNVPIQAIRAMLRDGTPGNLSLADATLDRLKPCTTIELKGGSLR